MASAQIFKFVYIILFAFFAISPSVTHAEDPNLNVYQSNIQQLKKIVPSRPHDPNLHFNLANNYWKLGQYEKSIEHYKETLKVQPFDAEAHTGIGFAYGKIGQTKEAIHHYHEALKINPDDPKAHYRLGYEFINTGEFKKSEDLLQGRHQPRPLFRISF